VTVDAHQCHIRHDAIGYFYTSSTADGSLTHGIKKNKKEKNKEEKLRQK